MSEYTTVRRALPAFLYPDWTGPFFAMLVNAPRFESDGRHQRTPRIRRCRTYPRLPEPAPIRTRYARPAKVLGRLVSLLTGATSQTKPCVHEEGRHVAQRPSGGCGFTNVEASKHTGTSVCSKRGTAANKPFKLQAIDWE